MIKSIKLPQISRRTELPESKSDVPVLRSGALQRAFEALEKFFLSRHFAYSLAAGGAAVLCLSFPLALLALKIGFFKTLLVAGGVFLGSAAAFRICLPFIPNPAPRPNEIEMRPAFRRGPRPPEELPNPSYPFPRDYAVVEAGPKQEDGTRPLRILIRLVYDAATEQYVLPKKLQKNWPKESFTLDTSFYRQTHLLSRFFIHTRTFARN